MADVAVQNWPTYPAAVGVAEPTVPVEYAGFGIRFAARLIDTLITYAIAAITGLLGALVIVTALMTLGRPVAAIASRLASTGGWSLLLSVAGSVAYFTLAEAIHGSTPGKMILGLQVLRDTGEPCGLGSALGREVAFFIDSLFFGIPAYISMKRGAERKRYGDRWAHTVVVRRRSISLAQRRPVIRFVGACFAACIAYSVLLFMGLLVKL
jgi:Mce-associated membrane protein